MAKWFWAVMLAVAFVGEANAAPQTETKTDAAKFAQALPDILESRCDSLQLFAAMPGDEQMKWVAEIPYDVCVKYHEAEMAEKSAARAEQIFERSFKKNVAECVRSKQYPTDEDCVAASKMSALAFFVDFELTGNVCARFTQEHTGNNSFRGVCVPYAIPSENEAAWREMLSVLYSHTNVTLKVDANGSTPEEEYCTSGKAEGVAGHLIDAVRTAFAQDKTAEAVLSHLQSEDFECTQDKRPTNGPAHECFLSLGGFRFSRAATTASSEVNSGYFSDSLSVKVEADAKGGAPKICTRMMSVGL